MKKFQYSNEGYSPIEPEEVPEEIKNILICKCDVLDEYISSDATWENLGLDSLDVVELAMEVEKEYEIALPDLEIEKCYTLGDFVKLVESTRLVERTKKCKKYKR